MISTLRLSSIAMLVVAVLASGGSTYATEPPSPFDQYMLEVINRTRHDPDAEAASFGIDLNEGPPSSPIASGPRQPLVYNALATVAADLHNEDLLANFDNLPADHRGSDGRSPQQRVDDAGADNIGVGENNAWKSQSNTKLKASSVDQLHALLFKDFTASFEVVGRGHRRNLVDARYREIGVSVVGGVFGGRKVALCTQDFLITSQTYITGVVFADVETDDDFYTPGEGIGEVRIVATLVGDEGTSYETTTWPSGGYNLAVPAGTYTITATGNGIDEIRVGVVVEELNVKVDFQADELPPPPPPPPPPPVFRLDKGLAKLNTKKGLWTVKLAKVAYSPGFWSYDGDLRELRVVINGLTFFDPESRGGIAPKLKRDKVSGEIVKIAIKTPEKHKLTIDLVKQKIKVIMKNIADEAFDPSDGITTHVYLGGTRAVMNSTTTIIGKKQNKALMNPTTGDVGPIPE